VHTAEVVPSLKDTEMQVLYKQPDGVAGNNRRAQSPALIRAGPGPRGEVESVNDGEMKNK
jgi:hypothetical protein